MILHVRNRNRAGAVWLVNRTRIHVPSLFLLGTFLSLLPPRNHGTRGTDSHTSRVSIKRRRKCHAFLDRCGLHGSAKQHLIVVVNARQKETEGHTCARPVGEWVFRDRKCHRAIFFDYRTLFAIWFAFSTNTYRLRSQFVLQLSSNRSLVPLCA